MRYIFSEPLRELDGTQVFDNKKVITLGQQCVLALCAPQQDDDGVKKFTKAGIAERIFKSPHDCDLTAEEVVLVKEVTGKFLSPIAILQIWRLLESPISGKEKE